jgi:hypothetical protein
MDLTMNVKRMRLAAVAVAVLGIAALSGCSGTGVANVVNGAVHEATGGDVSLGGQLPAGWPEEIPVIDGKILFGAANTTNGDKGWVVTIHSSSADPLADAKKKLEDAGFNADTSTSANVGGAGVAALTNDTYTVAIAGTPDGILYTVGAAS